MASAAPQPASTLPGFLAQVAFAAAPRRSARRGRAARVRLLGQHAPEVACVAAFAAATSRPISCTCCPAIGSGRGTARMSLAEHLAPCAPARAARRVGRRVSPPRCWFLRRPAAARRAAARLLDHDVFTGAAAGHRADPDPFRPPGRGVPGRHRPAQRANPSTCRLRRVTRRRRPAARAARQAAQRPLYPAAPQLRPAWTAGLAARRASLGAPTSWSRMASASARAVSTGPSPDRRGRRGGHVSRQRPGEAATGR